MNILKTIRIGGLTYKIVITNGDNLDNACGDCDASLQTIRLNEVLSPEALEFTLWHEVAHAWNSTWSEGLVDSIAQMISSVVQNNKVYNQKEDIS